MEQIMEQKNKFSRWDLLKHQLNNLDPEAFQLALRKVKEATLIDCRQPAEVAAGKLPGAVNIDYLAPDFWEQIEQLDPTKAYFVYCRTGRRSVRTCTLMRNGGFKKVYHLDGGLNHWITEFGPASLVSAENE